MRDKNLSVLVYENIKRLLVGLHFPPGAILKERGLAEMLGVSRTPVREAMQRLAHEGWVTIGDGKRIHVSSVTKKDVEEIFLVREMIEPIAARHAIENAKMRVLAGSLGNVLADMRGVEGNQRAFIKLDMKFHSVFIKNMNNQRISRLWLGLHGEIVRIGLMALTEGDRFQAVIKEHSLMVDALRDKDESAVMEAVTDHLITSKHSLFAKWEKKDPDVFDKGVTPVEDWYRMPDDF